MAKLTDIVEWLSAELELNKFDDSSLNGLQVEGSSDVQKIAVTVDAALKTAELAKDTGADLLLVHHGIFWKQPLAVTGAHKKLLETLFSGNIGLYAAHLPLDAHERYGNNFSLARLLKLEGLEPSFSYGGQKIGCKGNNSSRLSINDIKNNLAQLEGSTQNMLVLNFGPEVPNSIGIISGAGADAISSYKQERFDTFITGEPRQSVYHFARENKLNAIFAGHYSTEVIGVKKLGEEIAKRFSIEWTFLDCPTGI